MVQSAQVAVVWDFHGLVGCTLGSQWFVEVGEGDVGGGRCFFHQKQMQVGGILAKKTHFWELL